MGMIDQKIATLDRNGDKKNTPVTRSNFNSNIFATLIANYFLANFYPKKFDGFPAIKTAGGYIRGDNVVSESPHFFTVETVDLGDIYWNIKWFVMLLENKFYFFQRDRKPVWNSVLKYCGKFLSSLMSCVRHKYCAEGEMECAQGKVGLSV